ncbi:hypothetical protein PLESTB_000067400 [Pleodorina starrii]|uniref:Uncharacterized protein n=1 Tax=Pleodorina starrii TaxID=330485 RepID=A0A9W6B9N5_9CHLO|nr:hypothetical protein PLESTB_000067400 [Pleodorina starrii]
MRFCADPTPRPRLAATRRRQGWTPAAVRRRLGRGSAGHEARLAAAAPPIPQRCCRRWVLGPLPQPLQAAYSRRAWRGRRTGVTAAAATSHSRCPPQPGRSRPVALGLQSAPEPETKQDPARTLQPAAKFRHTGQQERIRATGQMRQAGWARRRPRQRRWRRRKRRKWRTWRRRPRGPTGPPAGRGGSARGAEHPVQMSPWRRRAAWTAVTTRPAGYAAPGCISSGRTGRRSDGMDRRRASQRRRLQAVALPGTRCHSTADPSNGPAWATMAARLMIKGRQQ